ncbi:MAG: hypothetical protein CM1200mP41_22730 [Gammaproteobacteria bacterium]|nr:MAG: hypothetical protein CM1200mP41_22730 [Gammaproteobacteria bacterium]
MLGGDLPLDKDLADQAIENKIARPLGISTTDAALGIIRLVNSNMALAIRSNSVARGVDPRDYSLIPFGGAGPLHGVALAEAVSAKNVIVPVAPGITAAWVYCKLICSMSTHGQCLLPYPTSRTKT